MSNEQRIDLLEKQVVNLQKSVKELKEIIKYKQNQDPLLIEIGIVGTVNFRGESYDREI